jgi:hypothetical protein
MIIIFGSIAGDSNESFTSGAASSSPQSSSGCRGATGVDITGSFPAPEAPPAPEPPLIPAPLVAGTYADSDGYSGPSRSTISSRRTGLPGTGIWFDRLRTSFSPINCQRINAGSCALSRVLFS